ncbi:MAG: flagellar assembly protein FliW [Rickettsiales bacterium]|jgi:flagellar assembly factor FliW|nr:flagellar assembly protein FliW [Rickettsiales bacterium]
MLTQSIVSGSQAAGVIPGVIKSRFGDVAVDAARVLTFPRGLLGMPDRFQFVLANFPNEKMAQFKLLQSLDDQALSFITLPVELQNPIVAQADIQMACRDLGIDDNELAMLLIVSVHRTPDQVKLSVNARAPLMIDAGRRLGVQHVFQSDDYKVQHMLG